VSALSALLRRSADQACFQAAVTVCRLPGHAPALLSRCCPLLSFLPAPWLAAAAGGKKAAPLPKPGKQGQGHRLLQAAEAAAAVNGAQDPKLTNLRRLQQNWSEAGVEQKLLENAGYTWVGCSARKCAYLWLHLPVLACCT
jgi:hypothetical protein